MNVFAFQATDPKVMASAKDPVGPQNVHLVKSVVENEDVLCAWGASVPKNLALSVGIVFDLIRELASRTLCLGLTKSGAPRHPLYVKGDTPMVDYRG